MKGNEVLPSDCSLHIILRDFFRHVMLKGVQISVDSRRIVDVVEYTGTIPVIG